MAKKIYLYDPRYNLKTETTYKELEEANIIKAKQASTVKTRGNYVRKLNKYIIDENTSLKEIREMYSSYIIENELWKQIEGIDDECYISNYGRVKKVRKTKTIFILPWRKSSGKGALRMYSYVHLNVDGKRKEIRVSNLVANHFLDKPNNPDIEYRVTHKNGILHDDYVGNLEWISMSELGKITGGKSKSQSIIQVDPYTYEDINSFKSAREAAKQLFTNRQTISDVANLKACYSANKEVFVKEDDYYNFIDSLDTKRYLYYNAKTEEKFKGTLPEISEKYNYDIHCLRYAYENKKNIIYTKCYVLNERARKLPSL